VKFINSTDAVKRDFGTIAASVIYGAWSVFDISPLKPPFPKEKKSYCSGFGMVSTPF
jgi:hypothetical protein